MNLPNKLSIFRIVLVPFIMFFYLAPWIPYGIGKALAIVLFIVAALTDLFDGNIARKKGLVTDLGKLLDPIADKMLITCSLFLIVFDQTIAFPWGIIALTVLFIRDCIVNGVRQVAATKGVAVAAEWSGKLKAILAYIYIPWFMFVAILNVFADVAGMDIAITVFSVIGYIVMAAATIVTAWSAIDYPLKNKAVILGDDTKKENEHKQDDLEVIEEQVTKDDETAINEENNGEEAGKEDHDSQ